MGTRLAIDFEGTFTDLVALGEGDVVRFITGSGGGYGDPRRRDPSAVLNDVLDGYLSEEAARDVYGMVLEGDPVDVDGAKTIRLTERGLIDREPPIPVRATPCADEERDPPPDAPRARRRIALDCRTRRTEPSSLSRRWRGSDLRRSLRR